MNASSPALDGEIRDGRHLMTVRVYYEDTDFSGIVYHANYLRFMERGRTNHLRLLGAGHRTLFEEAQQEAPGFAFVVRSMQIEFLKPARMDDVLQVMTAPEEVKGASITLLQQCRRGEELLCEAHVRVAFISGGRARPIRRLCAACSWTTACRRSWPVRWRRAASASTTAPTSSTRP